MMPDVKNIFGGLRWRVLAFGQEYFVYYALDGRLLTVFIPYANYEDDDEDEFLYEGGELTGPAADVVRCITDAPFANRIGATVEELLR
jgi:hypothetical protein